MAGGYQVNADAIKAFARLVRAQGEAVDDIIQGLRDGHVASTSMGELPESESARSTYSHRVTASLSDLHDLAQYLDQTTRNLQGSTANYMGTDEAAMTTFQQTGGGL